MTNKEKLTLILERLITEARKGTVEDEADLALYYLLNRHREEIEQLSFNQYFFKVFRVTDVTDSGYTDLAIWHLINSSERFMRIFDEVTGEKDED